MFAYIGSRTTKERKALGEGITVYRRAGTEWEKIQTLSCGPNPSYLCLNEKKDRLYAVHGDYSTVTAFQVGEDGKLTELNSVSSYGTNPVHLVASPNGQSLYVANLETGSIARLALEQAGGWARSGRFCSFLVSPATGTFPIPTRYVSIRMESGCWYPARAGNMEWGRWKSMPSILRTTTWRKPLCGRHGKGRNPGMWPSIPTENGCIW